MIEFYQGEKLTIFVLTSITALRILRAAYNVLGGEYWGLGVICKNSNPGLKHGHCGKGITAATISLISYWTEVIFSTNVSPIKLHG